jgi:hypothetical protein
MNICARMPQPVTIENDALRVEVWPQFGGKVSSVVDKVDRFELLFTYPAEFPSDPQYDLPYAKGWYAGWDECFPAVAPGRYVGHPYDGVAVPDHGELWGLPTTSVPAKNGITSVWHGLRFGYRLTRKLTVDGPTLAADYTLVNLAPFDFRFVWAQHALLSMNTAVELSVDQRQFRLSHDAKGNELQRPFEWDNAGGDLAAVGRPHAMPSGGGWKIFGTAPITTPVVVRYPQRAQGRRLTISYAADDLAAYWGIWVNTGGWAGHQHFAVEPTTGRFDQLDRAIRDESAGWVPPLGRRDWCVRWSVA